MSSINIHITGDCDINNTLYAPSCKFGTEHCNICVKEIDGEKKLIITLPNRYRGSTMIERYDMRSIIESIQELNRRTATISCNRQFSDSINMYDISDNDVYNQFNCEQISDDLPSATNGNA